MTVKHAKQTGLPDDEGDATKVNPSDWYAAHTTGSADDPPSSPSAFDDEFTSLSGWTTLGTLDVSNVSDFPGNWHVKRTTSATVEYNGIYKTAPSMPFTVTVKFSDYILDTNYQSVGILLTEASPGKLASFDFAYASAYYATLRRWTNRTTWSGSSVDVVTSLPALRYMRLIVTSSTNVTMQWSHGGFVWYGNASLVGVTTSLTVANVGLGVSSPVSSSPVNEAVFDWIRFT